MAYKMPEQKDTQIQYQSTMEGGSSFMNTANGGKKSAELAAMVHYKSEGLYDVLAV